MSLKLILAIILLTVIAFYLVAMGILYLRQDSIIFPHWRLNEVPEEQVLARNPQHIALQRPDGITLRGLQFGATDEDAPLVLLFGGNAHNVMGFAEFVDREITEGSAVVVGINYRGYGDFGIKSDGSPSQDAILADALAEYDEFTQRYPNRPVHVIGYSLGSSVATYVASQRHADTLILVTPFTSMVDIGKQKYGFIPVQKLLKHPFPTLDWLHHVTAPTTLIFAENDEVIPHSMREPLIHGAPNLRSSTLLANETHGDILHNKKIPALFKAGMRLE